MKHKISTWKHHFASKADYWKSNDRKYCEFCKCWITDNKPSVAFHENGKRHKANVAKRISEISRNSAKSEKDKQKFDQELRKMEDAAMRSYAQDISQKADLTARSLSVVMDSAGSSSSTGVPRPVGQIDPLRLQGDSDDEDDRRVSFKKVDLDSIGEGSMWIEAKTDEGHTYYWNVKTNDSVWEAPKEGFMSLEEYNRINQIAVAQQQLQAQKESKEFRESADEVVARYRREQFKAFRRPDTEAVQKEIKRNTYRTEEDVQGAAPIGSWQVVEQKEEKFVDLELPERSEYYVPQVVSDPNPEPPVKRFKEKTISNLDSEVVSTTPATFKKRKIANRGNPRQKLDDE